MTASANARKRAARNDKFKFPFELDEYQIGMKLEHCFGLLEAGLGMNFELESSVEGKTGADYEYQGIQARYYLQAKAPIALKSTAVVPISAGKENEGLNAVRAFRRDNGLSEDPYSFCFGLRKPAKHANVPEELQHNLLYAMNDPSKGSHAMYVAPTTHSKEEYLRLLRDRWHLEILRETRYWGYAHPRDRFAIHPRFAAEILMNSPFLQAHICITPHAKVTTHEHHYSYSVHANDVAFHSPTVLERGSQNLSDFLASQVRQIGRVETQTPEVVVDSLKRALPESVARTLGTAPQEGPLGTIRQIGRLLWEQYGITQYLVMKRKEG